MITASSDQSFRSTSRPDLWDSAACALVFGEMDSDSGPSANDTGKDGADDLGRRSAALRGALTRYFSRQVADRSEIDDLVQDVFLRIVKRGGSQGLENFDGYVFETAASVLKDRFRRRKARHAEAHLTFDPDVHSGTDFGPDAILAGRQALRSTTVALMELPERTRNVFVLRRIEGLSYQEIARRLGLSISAVEKHMVRAARHLMTRVEDVR